MKKIITSLAITTALIVAGCQEKGKETKGEAPHKEGQKTTETKTGAGGTITVGSGYVKPAFPISEAEKIIKDYVKGMHRVSKVEVYEGKKYYIGEVYLEGYPDNVVRKVYLSKTNKDVILPTMAETFDYKYMIEAEKNKNK